MEQPPTTQTGLKGRLAAAFRSPMDERSREIVEILRSAPLFDELSGRTLRRLADYVHVRDYRAAETIFYDGDPGIGLYVIARGRVTMLLEEPDGAVHELRVAGPGEMFGELAVLGGSRRTETAQATSDCRVIGFFRPDLLSLVKRHPRSGAELMSAFAHFLARRELHLLNRITERDGRLAALRLVEGDAHNAALERPNPVSTLNP